MAAATKVARALICLILLSAGSASHARTFAPGSLKARWPVKTSFETGAKIGSPRDVPIADLIALPNIPGVASQDPQYRSERIPTAVNGLHEGDIIRTKGWVHVIAEDNDGDFHIQVTDSPTSGNHCFIVELPMDKAKFESNAAERARCAKLRTFLCDKLLHDPNKQPSAGGNWMAGECYMTITGQIFFDSWHVGGAPRGVEPGNHAGKAATLWEIHPITAISFAAKPH